MSKPAKAAVFLLSLIGCLCLHAQDVKDNSLSPGTGKLYTGLSRKASAAEQKLDHTTDKYLDKLQRQEEKIHRRLLKKDSTLAHQLFDGVQEKYAALNSTTQKLSKNMSAYSGHLDSLATALNFLKDKNGLAAPELQKTIGRFSSLQGKLNQTEAVKKFIAERKQLLKENLGRFNMVGDLKGFQKQAYYYAQQVKEYKALWEDPDKLEKKLLEEVAKLPQFRDFFRKNSALASLFSMPGSGGAPAASLAGLQTRASMQQVMTTRFGTGPNVQSTLQDNMQAAQGQLNELKNRLMQYGNGSVGNGDPDLPKNFRPNTQRTKTFLDRLEYGFNIQSQKSGSYFPVTSDLGLSLGYRLNDNSAIGIGASYKLGLGRNWSSIRMTSEGIGLRSYLDVRLKGSLYISGGYEQNYRTAFHSIQQLKNYSAWQSSGLIGLSKKYKVSKKLKGDVKLLWDFLSYRQVPRTQSILFRIGYGLK